MNDRRSRKISALTLFVGLLALAAAPPLAGRPPSNWAVAAETPDDDGLVFENQGAQRLPPDRQRRPDNGDWMRLETDSCGVPLPSRAPAPMLRQSGLMDPMDGFDDPSVEALQLIGQLLSQHPELAVISDGVIKACDDTSPLFDQDMQPEFIAKWHAQPAKFAPPVYIA